MAAVVRPALQAVQAPPAPVEKKPMAHGEQSDAPTDEPAAELLPAPQGLHCVLAAALQAAEK